MRRIFETIEAYHMIEEGSRVIAGVSGGADSVCLLYALQEYRKKLPFEIYVVHVEHGLRGEESLEDARFVEDLCKKWEIPCRTVQVNVKELAGRQGISEEEAGRMERYRIFEEMRRCCGAKRIAVAHNENDQAETVLHHLVRGSGLRGLCGIRPVRDAVIRPLLYIGRREIEQILLEAGIPWRTDRTNLEREYTRNRIRLSVLPQMEQELNSRAAMHIAQAAGRLLQVQEYLERVTQKAAQNCIVQEENTTALSSGECAVRLKEFFGEDELIRREILKRALELCGGQRDVGAVHLEALMGLGRMDCGKEVSLPGGLRAVREKDEIRFTRKRIRAGGQPEVVISGPGNYETPAWEICVEVTDNNPALYGEIIEEKKYTKWFSYDTIKGTILFRTRREGDYLVINGQGGRKKLKDYLIDCKVPKEQRDQLWLLADGSHVLWVTGYRISEAAKVTKTTEKVLKIQLKEKENEGKSKDFFAGAGSERKDC